MSDLHVLLGTSLKGHGSAQPKRLYKAFSGAHGAAAAPDLDLPKRFQKEVEATSIRRSPGWPRQLPAQPRSEVRRLR